MLHLPQLAASLLKLASQPLPALLSQLPKLALQLPNPHAPATQAAVPLAGAAHAMLQAPQFFTSFSSFASQPVLSLFSQPPKPTSQPPTPHVPPLQAAAALAGAAQALPQALQFFTSVLRFDSQPLPALLSQL